MATKFLDYTGLSYLWSKFKEWCNSIFVTKATDENITGTKTFVGSKKIAFKQSEVNDKLGFTLFNNSGKEQGYLEYNPLNKIAGVPLMTLGNYATADNELTYVGFRRYSNISGASGAYNLLTPLISDAKTPFNLTTTYTNFYLPLGISDGTNIVTASNSGIFDISSLLSSISTIEWSNVTSKPTTISGYGITDAKIDNGTITLGSNTITPLTSHQTLPTLSRTISGSGNAITDITVLGHAITVTKGSTFLTSHQSLADYAKLASPAFTGTPTAPTAAASTNNTQIATTAFVKSQGYLTSHQTLPTLSLTTSGNGNAITALSVNDHAITVTKGASYITSSGSITGNAATATKTTATIAVDTTGELVRATMGSNDVFRIAVGGASNAGWAEIATGDDYNEPIYVRQYQGSFTTLKRTATLLDASGNTSFPGTVTAVGFSGSLTGDVNGNATTVSGTAGTSALSWNKETTLYTIGGHAVKAKLPVNPNSNWTSHLYAGASNGNANAATTNGNTYLIICDNTAARDRRLIKGTGATTVTSDANGVITIHSTDNNTTYSTATQSANGLMSAADKKKLDGIAAGADSIPVGAIIYYTNKTVPANFLICNGGAVSRTTYATLYGVIGTTYGKGNGSSTFNVPNLIGRFPEGNATPGTVHAAGLPNITGSFTIVGSGGSPTYYLFTEDHTGAFSRTITSGSDGYTSNHNNEGKCTTNFSATSSNNIYGKSSTVQPPALTLVPCIRYA